MTQQNKLRNKYASSRDHILDIGFQSDARNVIQLFDTFWRTTNPYKS